MKSLHLSLLVFGLWWSPVEIFAQGGVLPLNGSAGGTISPAGATDVWSLTTNADGKINLTLTAVDSQYCYVALYDLDKTTLLASPVYTNHTVTTSIDGLAAGTYYVKIYPYYNTGNPTYTISNTLTVATPGKDTEPNDTYATATTLAQNATVTGHVGYYYNHHRDTADWYKVTTNGDGKLTLKLTPANGQYMYCSLYDTGGTTLLNQTYGLSTFYVNTDGLAAGTYYIRLYCYYLDGFAPYTLTDSLFTPDQAKDPEPNDTYATATTLALNATVTGHVGYYFNHHRDTSDWYKVTTTGDGLLKLKLTPANGQYMYCSLYDSDGVTLLNQTYGLSTFYVNTDGLGAGTYFIRLYMYYTTGFAPYTLTDSLIEPDQAKDPEPNSTYATATTLAQNSTTTGRVGYYYNHRRDTADWYKITTSDDGMLQLKLTPVNGQYTYCDLYDLNGMTRLSSVYGNSTFYVNTDGLAKGTYYVRIYCYYTTGFTPYILTDSLITYNFANDSTPDNARPYQAQTIPANRTVTGHVGFYYNLKRDTTDWWKINYTGGDGNLNLYFTQEPDKSNVTKYTYLQVYKDTAAAPIFNTYFIGTAVHVINLSSLTQGYYYIKIFTYYQSEFQSYSIADSFTQVNIATLTALQATAGNDCSSSSIQYQAGQSSPPYTVRLYRYGQPYGSPVWVSDTNPFTIGSLPPGNYYATAYGDGATDSAYGTSEVLAVVPVTTGTNTTNIMDTSATINWTMLPCIKYDSIHYRVQGATDWINAVTPDNSATYTLSGLSPNTTYEFQVAAVDTGNGQMITGDFSAVATFTTTGPSPVTSLNNHHGNLRNTPATGPGFDNFGWEVFGNPVNDNSWLRLQLDRKAKVAIQVIALNGRIIQSTDKGNFSEGVYTIPLHINNPAHGIYIIKLVVANQVFFRKVIW